MPPIVHSRWDALHKLETFLTAIDSWCDKLCQETLYLVHKIGFISDISEEEEEEERNTLDYLYKIGQNTTPKSKLTKGEMCFWG